MYSRKSNRIYVSSDKPTTFKSQLKQRSQFDSDRQRIWNRSTEYLPIVAKTMAASYKNSLDMFPSHYDYDKQSFELEEPKAFHTAKKKDKNKAAFIQGILQSIVADGRRDKLAVLIIGLVNAGKVPHWTGFDEENLSDAAFTETDADSDE